MMEQNNDNMELPNSQLEEFWHDLNNDFDFECLEDRFSALTHYLMNYLCLMINDNPYRIIELEIYYHDKENHPDPYVHCSPEQLHPGNWYFSGIGLDITFGDAEKEIYGGILIRGIMKFGGKPKYISGPLNVIKEIFSNLGSVIDKEGGVFLKELDKEKIEMIEEEPIQSTRIGLTKKNNYIENYADKKYRYLVEINLNHKFKNKEKVIRQLLSEKRISINEAKEIMGYKMKV